MFPERKLKMLFVFGGKASDWESGSYYRNQKREAKDLEKVWSIAQVQTTQLKCFKLTLQVPNVLRCSVVNNPCSCHIDTCSKKIQSESLRNKHSIQNVAPRYIQKFLTPAEITASEGCSWKKEEQGALTHKLAIRLLSFTTLLQERKTIKALSLGC